MSSLQSDHRYALELFRGADGALLGRAAVRVDWAPALEWTRFETIRKGGAPAMESGGTASIQPLWDLDSGAPYVSGFHVGLQPSGGAGEAGCDFTISYFRELAHTAASLFVERGALEAGDRFRYVVLAFPGTAPAGPESAAACTMESLPQRLSLRPRALSDLQDGALPHGGHDGRDLPVFVPQRILDEAAALARDAGNSEAGGVLVGHLCRDTRRGECFMEVTALIVARHAEATPTSLKFTPEVWSDVKAAVDLRHQGEIWTGWLHTHPVRHWCATCTPEKQHACKLASDFLSEHDRKLHRSVFPAAYSIALVLNDTLDGISFSLFGWREGLLEPRGFHITGAAESSRLAHTMGGDEVGA